LEYKGRNFCYDVGSIATVITMKTYPVVLIQDDGTPKILGVYNKYEDADRAVDKFSDLYPNGYVDVLIS
jgi:hypothetical protein